MNTCILDEIGLVLNTGIASLLSSGHFAGQPDALVAHVLVLEDFVDDLVGACLRKAATRRS